MGDTEVDPATITPYRDGPYIVRGRFTVVEQNGREILVGRRTIALCRCGRSRIRPLCDGTHRAIGFRAPGRAESYDERGHREADSSPAPAPELS